MSELKLLTQLYDSTYLPPHQSALVPGEYLKGTQYPSPHPAHPLPPACAPKKHTRAPSTLLSHQPISISTTARSICPWQCDQTHAATLIPWQWTAVGQSRVIHLLKSTGVHIIFFRCKTSDLHQLLEVVRSPPIYSVCMYEQIQMIFGVTPR